MNIKCPNCNSSFFHYMQECTECWSIDRIGEGYVDLGNLLSSHPHVDGHKLYCVNCELEMSIEEYNKKFSSHCKFCGNVAKNGHRHQEKIVCEECWDERLKITE